MMFYAGEKQPGLLFWGGRILLQSNGCVFVQFSELTQRCKLPPPHPCTTPIHNIFVLSEGVLADGCVMVSSGASKAHGPHHIVLSCRWTPYGPCWGFGETPACCAKLRPYPDIKNSTRGGTHCYFKIHGTDMPRGCVGVNVKASKRYADVSYISETKMSNRELRSRPLRARGLRERGI